MAYINIKQILYPLGILFAAAVVGFFSIIFLIIILIIKGVPIHDFNLWRLETNFKFVVTHHPSDSILIENKKYLGGPDSHGSQQCNYAVGEVRSSAKSREEIVQAYKNLSVLPIEGFKPIPVKVLFAEDLPWEPTWPLSLWSDELYEKKQPASKHIYLVYVMHEGFPFWGDYRCYD